MTSKNESLGFSMTSKSQIESYKMTHKLWLKAITIYTLWVIRYDSSVITFSLCYLSLSKKNKKLKTKRIKHCNSIWVFHAIIAGQSIAFFKLRTVSSATKSQEPSNPVRSLVYFMQSSMRLSQAILIASKLRPVSSTQNIPRTIKSCTFAGICKV